MLKDIFDVPEGKKRILNEDTKNDCELYNI
jgi:hypothetical protein